MSDEMFGIDEAFEDDPAIEIPLATDDEIVEQTPRLFVSSVDESEAARLAAQLPAHEGIRNIMERSIRLNQLHGDKDAQIADFTRDINSELFSVMIELRDKPIQLIMASLADKSEDEQLMSIEVIIDVLRGRQDAIIRSQLERQPFETMEDQLERENRELREKQQRGGN